MFDGAAGAPLRRTRAEQREAARAVRAARERARAAAFARSARFVPESEQLDELIEDVGALHAAGDLMQSAGSRVLAGIRRIGADRALGYEDSLALSELRSAIDQWTEARRA